jgi:multimeric flavodoxin WrbA
MPVDIEVQGLEEALRKFETIPQKVNSTMKTLMEKSMRVLWENVPPYPPKPETSKYRRTGTLGRSLGAEGAKPTVYSIKGSGANMSGTFGTNLSYAKYVIDPERQAYMHKGRWWTMNTIKEKSLDKINKIWETFIKTLLSMK